MTHVERIPTSPELRERLLHVVYSITLYAILLGVFSATTGDRTTLRRYDSIFFILFFSALYRILRTRALYIHQLKREP